MDVEIFLLVGDSGAGGHCDDRLYIFSIKVLEVFGTLFFKGK